MSNCVYCSGHCLHPPVFSVWRSLGKVFLSHSVEKKSLFSPLGDPEALSTEYVSIFVVVTRQLGDESITLTSHTEQQDLLLIILCELTLFLYPNLPMALNVSYIVVLHLLFYCSWNEVRCVETSNQINKSKEKIVLFWTDNNLCWKK